MHVPSPRRRTSPTPTRWMAIASLAAALVAACGGGPGPTAPGATSRATQPGGPGPGATAGPGETSGSGPRNLTGTLEPRFVGGIEVAGIATDGTRAWVTDGERDVVAVVDLAAGSIVDEFEVGASPLGIAYADGEIWVANASPGDHRVLRLNAETGDVLAEIEIPAGRTTTGIALGEGAAWVTTSGSGEVVRIDPATNEIVATIADQDITAAGTIDVVVAFGSVWTIDNLSGSVVRIDPATNAITDRYTDLGAVEGGARGPLRLAVDDSRVWVLSTIDAGSTGMFTIDPATGATELAEQVGARPDSEGLPAFLIDSAGGAWFAIDERLLRLQLDVKRADTIHTEIAVSFSAIAEVGDRVWFGMRSSFDEDITGLYSVELARITAP